MPSFEEWRDLAMDDPGAFEARRRAVIMETIASAPPHRRRRLERLQWRIDQERVVHSDPLAACQAMSRMMWESVYSDHGLLAQIKRLDARWHGRHEPPEHDATILPFRRRDSQHDPDA